MFVAGNQCCACTGQCDQENPEDCGVYDGCVNDLSSVDGDGDNCDEYIGHPGWCGYYDTLNFHSFT